MLVARLPNPFRLDSQIAAQGSEKMHEQGAAGAFCGQMEVREGSSSACSGLKRSESDVEWG